MNANGHEVKMDTVYRGQMMNFIVRGPIVSRNYWLIGVIQEVLSSAEKVRPDGRHKTIAMIRRF